MLSAFLEDLLNTITVKNLQIDKPNGLTNGFGLVQFASFENLSKQKKTVCVTNHELLPGLAKKPNHSPDQTIGIPTLTTRLHCISVTSSAL